ncbi:hypothetical protein BpHYR1_002447 [Brachionus plicatilis]|uniref:Uncharacterized protein n=1 Tax=Brachionus plicatilis TaxID=10195 RepID=A0A3M7QWM4_BRAPC|nr:hypothetical protein BpHYR1_002447 [Brachionus plicatilis]
MTEKRKNFFFKLFINQCLEFLITLEYNTLYQSLELSNIDFSMRVKIWFLFRDLTTNKKN